MGNSSKKDDIVLFFDNYGADSQNLHTSFLLAGKKYPVVVIEDDGFLPDGVTSVYGYFLGEFPTGKNIPGKPRYFNQINVPDYWEISANNSSGKVHELNKERAHIFYVEPKHKRLVKVVDWLDDLGIVRSSDHYNRYGALYARTIFDHQGQRINKSYFSADGREIIIENYVTRDIILNEGNQVHIFSNKREFVSYFMKKTGYEHSRLFYNTLANSFLVSEGLEENQMGDVLFWQEPVRSDIPGNMRIILEKRSKRTAKIIVQNRASYEKFLELGISKEEIQCIGYIYPFKKENTHRPEVLICTNSDNIAQCRKIVEAVSEVHFSIAAITEMSSKLMSMEQYENVSLYPGAKTKILDELFWDCDYYLDINYENEIVSAVRNAFLHNHVILGFQETAHNRSYTPKEHLYAMSEAEQLIAELKKLTASAEYTKEQITRQQEWAMSECSDAFLLI